MTDAPRVSDQSRFRDQRAPRSCVSGFRKRGAGFARQGGMMRDFVPSEDVASAACFPKGIAFAIADLVLAKSWAAYHDFTMLVRLDHAVEDEEYEEVLEFRTGRNGQSRLIMWCNAQAVFVQPLPGRPQRHKSVTAALETLFLQPPFVLSDITAPFWPKA